MANNALIVRVAAATLVLFLLSTAAFAQVSLKGTIRDTEGRPAEFVNVVLVLVTDTSTIVCGGISDIGGGYSLPPARPGNYKVILSAIGYARTESPIRLRMPTIGTFMSRDFTIDRADIELDEVQSVASRKTDGAGKSSYTFLRSEVAKSRTAADLVSGIDELRIDPQTERITLSQAMPGELKILINGVASTDEDLKAIPPDKVVKCEYYSIPPARYSSVSAVVNVITKNLETGWGCGADVIGAVSTGFVNGTAYARLSTGNHQTGVDYRIEHREYSDRRSTADYKFSLYGEPRSYAYSSVDTFGYTEQSARLKYLFTGENGTTLQIIASPGFGRQHADGVYGLNYATNGDALLADGISKRSIKKISPTVDAYFSKGLKKGQTLDLNAVVSYFDNDQSEVNTATSNGTEIISDHMRQKTKKFSVIGEIAYTKEFSMSKSISAGYRCQIAKSRSSISNMLSGGDWYVYHSDLRNHYAYAEYSASWRHASLRASAGATIVNESNDKANNVSALFTPKVTVAVPLTKGQSLQFAYAAQAEAPTISQLSDNAAVEIPGVIRQGNPDLRTSSTHIWQATYRINTKHIDIIATALAAVAKDLIVKAPMKTEIDGAEYIAIKSVNADRETDGGGVCSISYKPFDLLSIQLSAIALYSRQEVPGVETYGRWYTPLTMTLSLKSEKWGVTYNGRITSDNPTGAYCTSDEPQSHLTAYVQIRKVRIKAGCLWLFSEAEYDTRTMRNSVIDYNAHTAIGDNRNMFTLGLSVDLNGGKRQKETSIRLSNKDNDSGSF